MTINDYARMPFLYLGGQFIKDPIKTSHYPKTDDPTITMYSIDFGHDIRVQLPAEIAAYVAQQLLTDLYDTGELPLETAKAVHYLANAHLLSEEEKQTNDFCADLSDPHDEEDDNA